MKQLIKSLIAKTGYKVISTKYILKQFLLDENILKLDFDHVLSKYLMGKTNPSEVTFMQIGAFDGVECDPLRKYLLKFNWRGIMLEPQPIPYQKLKEEYKDRNNLIIVNAALSDMEGKTHLFILEGDTLPEWSKGMASFNKQNILKHTNLIENLESYIKKIEIDTITFQNMLRKHSIDHLDLLQIDTEGYDAEILKMFPFQKLKPAIIHFESKHIPKLQLEQLLHYLMGYGYKVAQDSGEDMVAVLN